MDDSDKKRLAAVYALMRPCRVCPRNCRVDRPAGKLGYCRVGPDALVASAGPHFGEEPPLVGTGGSGTIFLAGCNLLCSFCQNYDISHLAREGTVPLNGDSEEGQSPFPRCSPAQIAEIMRLLEARGCHNINFVTPSHVMPQLLDAILLAREAGLTVPVVWNCGGYESVEALRLLEGKVGIYMPDAKFWEPATAARLAQAPDYPEVMRAALREMHRQVGDLEVKSALATRGLLVRHLVMPGGLDEARAILDFLADEISPNTCVNVMGQYRPEYHARRDPVIHRRPTDEEIDSARDHARRRGLRLVE